MVTATTNKLVIETERLRLLCCDKYTLEAIFDGDELLGAHLQITVPQRWSQFGERAFRYTYDKVISANLSMEWWTYLPVFKNINTLVGTCGFKGAPANGMVEIGYEVAEEYRGQGLATEIAGALIRKAFECADVRLVQAHTLAFHNASSAVLGKCGMTMVEEISDPEDGMLWRWEVGRAG
ncbi:MAG: GNAT family N-acetyltransferase [Chitinophagaceae bacterium]|nr:GNAT family N-acetyltransferase [Chitinophagaceae bacterium]